MPEHTTSERIERLLPEVIRRAALPGSPLKAVLESIGALLGPAEEVIGTVDAAFSPYRAPPEMLPFLASWLDLDRYLRPGTAGPASLFPAGEGALRNLLARTTLLGRARGTPASLIAMLETACNLGGFRLQEGVTAGGEARSFHLLIRAPPEAAALAELVEQVVASEKPAYVTHEVAYEGGGGGFS